MTPWSFPTSTILWVLLARIPHSSGISNISLISSCYFWPFLADHELQSPWEGLENSCLTLKYSFLILFLFYKARIAWQLIQKLWRSHLTFFWGFFAIFTKIILNALWYNLPKHFIGIKLEMKTARRGKSALHFETRSNARRDSGAPHQVCRSTCVCEMRTNFCAVVVSVIMARNTLKKQAKLWPGFYM